ncbi:mobilization protein, partial [Xanthomonas citri pv. citri]|nr:mobilization protein [Xanthomonas citri pv. citri]
RVREGHGRGDDEAAGADHGLGVDLLALQRRVREDREYREQAERDREHARRVRAESQRRELERRVAELGRGGAEESRGYGIGD